MLASLVSNTRRPRIRRCLLPRPQSLLVALLGVGAAAGFFSSCRKPAALANSDEAPAVSTAAATVRAPVVGESESRVYAVGELAQATDFEMKILSVRECKVDEFHQPQAGHIKLGVDAWFRGTTDREVPINPFNATLTDSEGNSYNMAFGGCSPGLQSARLRKDDEARGFISFEIPRQARSLKLEFRPFVLRTGNEPVRFDLAR